MDLGKEKKDIDEVVDKSADNKEREGGNTNLLMGIKQTDKLTTQTPTDPILVSLIFLMPPPKKSGDFI